MTFAARLLAFACLLASLAAPLAAAAQTMVRIDSVLGPIDVRLMNAQAPQTVANFLAYVRAGDYTDVFFHRNAWTTSGTPPTPRPFVIQAGGYRATPTSGIAQVASRGMIVNEASASRSNVRGTLAMAKIAGNPNSATSEWFINMGDNTFLDATSNNGGYTVFGRVTTPGMAVADAIAQLTIVSLTGTPLTELPVMNWQSGTTTLTREHLVRFNEVRELANATATDRIFNYLEAAYPQYLVPSRGAGGEFGGYTYRYYSASNAYIATKDGRVWCLVPSLSSAIVDLGTVEFWTNMAFSAGYY